MKLKIQNLKVNYYFDMVIFLLIIFFPMMSSQFRTEQMTRYLCYVILVLSLDLIWGYGGILSLGHSVLFGMGGYIYALSVQLQNGIPTFMRNGGITEIPSFLKALTDPAVGIIFAILIPGTFAFLLGIFLFFSRIGGMFFAVITLAMITLASLFLNNQSAFTGGANGITGIGRFVINGHRLSIVNNYYFVAAIVVLCYFFCRWLISSKFGKIVIAASEKEERVKFLGYNTPFFRAVLYGISGIMAGIAGVLFVPVSGIIAPTDITGSLSTLLIIAIAIGGKGTITGGIIGIVLIEWAQSILSESFSNVWQLILGVLVILIVFFVPDGLMGRMLFLQEKLQIKKTEKKKTVVSE